MELKIEILKEVLKYLITGFIVGFIGIFFFASIRIYVDYAKFDLFNTLFITFIIDLIFMMIVLFVLVLGYLTVKIYNKVDELIQ